MLHGEASILIKFKFEILFMASIFSIKLFMVIVLHGEALLLSWKPAWAAVCFLSPDSLHSCCN